ncbi:MAG: SIMPL domain-containing protein [Tenuifilaceae bacterium]
MKKILFIIVFLPMTLLGQVNTSEKTIQVVGFAETEIEPDIITISMNAKESESSTKESEIVKMENRIISFIKNLGIKPENFFYDRYSANSQFSFSSGSKYKLKKSYKLIINKPLLMDTIVAKCLELGMDNIFVSKLEHSKADSIQNNLLANAVNNGNLKAKIISQNAGIKLGQVTNVNESYQIVGNRSDMYYDNVFRLEETVIGYTSGYSKSKGSSSISLNKLHFSKTVLVKYEIQ